MSIKILVIKSDNGGCAKYRTIDPHKKIQELYSNDFEITFTESNWNNLDKYDIIQFHDGINQNGFIEYCKEHNIITVMDVDDYWELYPEHILYKSNRSEKIINNLLLSDYITTTTEPLKERIKQYNKNVIVIPNALDYNNVNKTKSDKIRFGFTGGRTHEIDMLLLKDVFINLPKEIMDKIEIILCGYPKPKINPYSDKSDTLGIDIYNHYKSILKVPVKIVYKKDINNYLSIYDNIDVLLAPLAQNEFNLCKSNLKIIEAGFTNTAIITSNFGPYAINSCWLTCNNTQDWINAITELTLNEKLRLDTTSKINTFVKQYDLNLITETRVAFYKEIYGKHLL